MFDIVLFSVGCLTVIVLGLKLVLHIFTWHRLRPMRRELDRRAIAYDPYDSLAIEDAYYRALQKDIQDALNEPA